MTSMSYNSAAGLSGMLKDGHLHLTESLLRNIDAATELSNMVKTSFGPHGMSKLVVNHLEKIFVTSDCACIIRELELEHPIAKLLAMAAEIQNTERGDGTNLTVSFAGELLQQTQILLRQGLHASEVIAGFQRALEKVPQLLMDDCLAETVVDTSCEQTLARVVSPVVGAKQYGHHDTVLAPLVAQACLAVMTTSGEQKQNSVAPEAVRVVKILGAHVRKSFLVHGFVAQRSVETTITKVENAKICVFGCGVEASTTEAKGTVLMKTADDLKTYNKTEEAKMESVIKSIADAGVHVICTGGSISEMALHFIERYKLMALKVGSKWELRRLCQAVGATALVRLGPPTPDEVGEASVVAVKEIGGRSVTVFESSEQQNKLATLVLRASTSSMLADLERAVTNGVFCISQLCKDGRLVYGAGATEMLLSVKLHQLADTCPGLDQYAVRAFAKALELAPKTLAENAGLDAPQVLARLGAAHACGEKDMGVDISSGNATEGIAPCGASVLDLLQTKQSALCLAVDTALTVLQVDQIIMSKQSGGGKAGMP